jgi:REP element-mobilizing transposase RayT
MNKTAPFIENGYFHVYNRTNNKESLFKNGGHRDFFLRKFKKYLFPYVYTHSYALMGNHFHFSIQVKSKEVIKNLVLAIPHQSRTSSMKSFIETSGDLETKLDKLIINQFQNFQISYAKAVNKDLGRTGSLFQKKFKRSWYNPSDKFCLLQYYIHHNARKHGFVKHFMDYPHHSYKEIINNNSSIINVSKVLEHFGSLQSFEQFHTKIHSEDQILAIDLENII